MATLKEKLSIAVAWCEDHPGAAYRVPLTHGLRVDLKITALTLVQISRAGAYPAAEDLAKVLAAWPYPVDPATKTQAMQYKGRHYLMLHWPSPAKLIGGADA